MSVVDKFTPAKRRGWIGVDLDRTLAEYTGWHGEFKIGQILLPMKKRIQKWLQEDEYDIKIFTARVCHDDSRDNKEIAKRIQDWLEENGLPRLDVTNAKDYSMVQLWDDIAVQMQPNTGLSIDEYRLTLVHPEGVLDFDQQTVEEDKSRE